MQKIIEYMLWMLRDGTHVGVCHVFFLRNLIVFSGQQAFLNPESRPDAFLDTNKIGIDWERVAAKVRVDFLH